MLVLILSKMGFTFLMQFLRSLMPDQRKLLAISLQVVVAGYLRKTNDWKDPQKTPIWMLTSFNFEEQADPFN